MKSITEILGGFQILLGTSYKIQVVFVDYVTNHHRIFLYSLQVTQASLPRIEEPLAFTGKKFSAILLFVISFFSNISSSCLQTRI